LLLIIDNYDSFTYNIYHGVDYPEKHIKICRNDQLKLQDIIDWKVKGIIISPGPMTPLESGLSNDIIVEFGGYIPILGICLGHQCIGYVYGCIVGKHYKPTHGKKSRIKIYKSRIFSNLEGSIYAARYHSLHIKKENFNYNDLNITAELDDGTIMAIEHKHYPIFGVQFHPESILSNDGKVILNNFIDIVNER